MNTVDGKRDSQTIAEEKIIEQKQKNNLRMLKSQKGKKKAHQEQLVITKKEQ